MTIQRFHWIVGLGTVFGFLGTGIYMRMSFPDVYAGMK